MPARKKKTPPAPAAAVEVFAAHPYIHNDETNVCRHCLHGEDELIHGKDGSVRLYVETTAPDYGPMDGAVGFAGSLEAVKNPKSA